MRESSFVSGHKSNYFILRNSVEGLSQHNIGSGASTPHKLEGRNQKLSINCSLEGRTPKELTRRSEFNYPSTTKVRYNKGLKSTSHLSKLRPTTALPFKKRESLKRIQAEKSEEELRQEIYEQIE